MEAAFDIYSLVRPNVLRMKPYSSARDEFKEVAQDMIFLDANENPYATAVNRYPDPQQKDVKSILALREGLESNQLLVGNGSDEVLDLLFRAFCIPGKDAIITVPPTYGMYNVLAETNDIKNHKVLLDNDFQIDVEAIRATITPQTKLLFICSPNNPTGNLISTQKIKKLLDTFNGLVVIDEAYIDFTTSESWTQQLIHYPNLIVTKTVSKAYGMAGIRLGMCWASSEIIAILNKIKPPYNVNKLTQEHAVKRVMDLDTIKAEVSQIIEQRNVLSIALESVPFVEKVYPSDANFILARVDDAYKRYDQLLKAGIVVRNRSTQAKCENTLRFTVGTPKENTQLLQILNSL